MGYFLTPWSLVELNTSKDSYDVLNFNDKAYTIFFILLI